MTPDYGTKIKHQKRLNKWGNTTWSVQNPYKDIIRTYVRIGVSSDVEVVGRSVREGQPFYDWVVLEMTRSEARLLAKRINQMLEETK